MAAQGLTAAERIRRRQDFERVYATGARISGRFMTVFVLSNGLTTSRLGVAATKKLGGAVERNRARRLAREVFRRHKHATGEDIVILPRREMLDAPFPRLEADYQDILGRPRRRSGPPDPRRSGGRRPSSAPRL